METLNVKGMIKNRHLSKAIAEQRLYDFKDKMKYNCEFNGIEFIEVTSDIHLQKLVVIVELLRTI
ncbi:hypothetical protein SAMN05421767_11829 [Granulicatella balaenopterae]|uniref:Uncharacterized protein n=2 Tax=Granulicatella balaenopterae TaxID=137733 RepID=A0A1H9LB55_9LACT|nr:hypothetical protein [Granulicatella balaenopterae]SER08712.1 hypothetical protein SAMN05421767_11829 [Granulicatella balaenopterae]